MNAIKTALTRLSCNFTASTRFFHKMNFKTIGTHNGTFHCDEVLGCFLLKQLCSDAEIIRSRDKHVLDKCDIVIDVGGEYDPSKLRFDHHQREFNHTMNSLRPEMSHTIKLSSAGLIYCHYGEEIIKKIMGDSVDHESLPHIYKKMYDSFIEEIDGIDNGVEMFSGEPKYTISTNLSKRVGALNKRWNETGDYDENKEFHKAMELAGKEFVDKVSYVTDTWWPAKKEIIDAVKDRYNVHESGEIILFNRWVPFIEHLLTHERELNLDPTIKFAIYPDGVTWRVRAVPVAEASFITRIPLLEAWRGIRDEELEAISKIKGTIFVHSTGFIGGNKTREGAIEMASKSIAAAIS